MGKLKLVLQEYSFFCFLIEAVSFGTRYSNTFPGAEADRKYLIGRFGAVWFVNHTMQKQQR